MGKPLLAPLRLALRPGPPTEGTAQKQVLL